VFNKRIKQVLGYLLFSLGIYKKLLGKRAVVVAFHRVSDDAIASSINCPPNDFRRYCRFFRRFFDVIDLATLIKHIDSGESIGGKLAITFDDGYEDNAMNAAPILKEMGLPATFFITTNFIGSDHQTFWDIDHGVESKWMSWDDVRQLDNDGFDIGGHTLNHVDLAEVDFGVAQSEIYGCRDRISSELNRSPKHFAYPFGGADQISDEARQAVMDAGFNCCTSCCHGLVSPGDSVDNLSREAITTWHVSPYQFGFEFVHRALQR